MSLYNDYNDSDNNISVNDVERDIYFMDLVQKMENIGKESDKEDFIKNYAEIKEQIELVDNILSLDTHIEKLKKLNVKELFEILELNSEKILNPEKLKTSELNYLINITKILDDKINNASLEISEIK